jgi:hypothetical protein
MGSLEVDSTESEHRLQTLLDGLLSVKTKHVIGYIGIVQQPVENRLVALGLAHQQRRKLTLVRTRQLADPRSSRHGSSCL